MNFNPTTTTSGRRSRFGRVASVLAGGALAAGALLGTVGPASAGSGTLGLNAPPTRSCTVPNHVSCKIADADGIARVVVRDNNAGLTSDGQGGYVYFPLNIVDKSFTGCPTNVTVGYDSAYSGDVITVVDCKGSSQTAKKA